MAHGFYSNQAHYVPTSGEISAMKIQGEGRNWPDAGLIFTQVNVVMTKVNHQILLP